MSSHGNNQPTGETPILQIASATFQAAVTAVVIAVMAHLNATNPNENRKSVDNSNCSNNQVNQQVSTWQDTLNPKPKNMKRRFKNEKGSSSTQGHTKKQQAGVVHTPTNLITSTPTTPYLGNLPHCKKCNYHNYGVCWELYSNRCNMKGHINRLCRTPF